MTLYHDNILNRKVKIKENSEIGIVRAIEWSVNGWESSNLLIELDSTKMLMPYTFLKVTFEND